MSLSISDVLTRPADEFGNDPEIERVWAMKAIEHMSIYFNLISSVPGTRLRLTPKDDLIFSTFEERFPDFRLDEINVESLKSDQAKVKWREFCNLFEGEVADFNWATMLRLNCADEYTETNTILVTRIQFLAIEIARNRKGFNDVILNKFGKKKPEEETSESL